MKVCSKCHIEKDESEFYKHSNRKEKLRAYCKNCKKQMNSEYFKANPDKRKKYRDKNKKKISEYRKAYWDRNKKHQYFMNLKWKAKNRNRVNEDEKNRCKQNREILGDRYIKELLKASGYSKEDIKRFSFLIDKKKLDVIIKRSDKLIKQNKKQQL